MISVLRIFPRGVVVSCWKGAFVVMIGTQVGQNEQKPLWVFVADS